MTRRGTCPCSIDRKCENYTHWCNCDDIKDEKWNADEGYYTKTTSLGITEMFFLQQSNLSPKKAIGRITLGPLECVETSKSTARDNSNRAFNRHFLLDTQRYVVTFTTSQSYIEVPGWRKGDLAFSFRTTGKNAVLLYQPPIRPNYPSFMVALTSGKLAFGYSIQDRII